MTCLSHKVVKRLSQDGYAESLAPAPVLSAEDTKLGPLVGVFSLHRGGLFGVREAGSFGVIVPKEQGSRHAIFENRMGGNGIILASSLLHGLPLPALRGDWPLGPLEAPQRELFPAGPLGRS